MENQAVDMKKAQDDAQVSSLYSHREISNKIGGGGCVKKLQIIMKIGRERGGDIIRNSCVDRGSFTLQRLYAAGEKKLGTDESTFNALLASQSYEQLRAVFDAYHKISGKDIEQVIKSEMSGNLEIGMVAIGG